MSKTGNIFDMQLFKRLLKYTRPYRLTFYFVALAAILLSFFGVARPYLTKITIDEGIIPKDYPQLIFYIGLMAAALILEVVFQFLFVYYANWLGQMVIRDLRTKLFKHMIAFKKQYYDRSSVGRLVTRAVSDIETIASVFSEGLFMIVSDLLKMAVVLIVMFTQSWKLSLLVITIMPFIVYATRVFQRKMKIAFEDVRNQVANLNSFVQEHLTGMKIVQIFRREETEYERFQKINEKHRKAWIKTVWYNSFYFPIADIASSFTIG
ncbi:MAG TPA: ABC transporter ATP-binding protein, partial [Flavobacteriaceae bacterium]|nr:ABC transporter ATP-binding protein [Flavobacteriaceae bacterium]